MKKFDIANKGYIEENASSKAFGAVLNSILLLSLIISLAFFSFAYYFIDVKVVGPSMQPTINAQWTTEEDFKQDTAYIKKGNHYQNGDIIVINSNNDLYVIKRLIGMSGDKINIVENIITEDVELYLNDELVIEDYVVYKSGMSYTLRNFNNLRQSKSELFVGDNLVVPEGFVFYLGDNRGQSQDCSFYGPVEEEKVIGRVNLVIPYGQTFFEYVWQEFKGLFN